MLTNVQSVEEVLAERSLFDELFQVPIRRGKDAYVDLHGNVRADRQDLFLLDRTQQLHLQMERQVADLVEEDRSAARGLEHAFARRDRAGERTAVVAE